MHLANLTTARIKKLTGLAGALFITSISIAQENSPYSRYGIGDIVPNQNIVNRAMGGISAGYSEFVSLNMSNPASLANIANTIFDIGGEVDRRTLKSNNSPLKYTATNTLISYIQVGFPISSKKMVRKGNSWGLSFGLRPVTRINYKIEENKRLSGIDSLNTLFEGSGGLSQFNVSTAIKIKHFSLGISTGYAFGNKDYSTRLTFINDSVVYYRSNTAAETNFGGMFLNVGAQYEIPTKNKGTLRLGGTVNLQQNLRASRDNLNETFTDDGNGSPITVDTISFISGEKGRIKVPMSYSFGFTHTTDNWIVGADINVANWSDYRYYGQTDAVQNTWTLRLGAQYFPATASTPASKYWSFVRYRAGLYYGNDYINLGEKRPEYGVTAGAGLPLTRRGDFVMLNTGVEIGARGNKNSTSLRENIARFNIGVSMNARWFVKPKYD
jgi:hypothetical protein